YAEGRGCAAPPSQPPWSPAATPEPGTPSPAAGHPSGPRTPSPPEPPPPPHPSPARPPPQRATLRGREPEALRIARPGQVGDQLLDHEARQSHRAAAGPGVGWPDVQHALDLDHDLGHLG